MQLLEDFVRWLLWLIAQAAFWLLDNIFNSLEAVATLDVLSFGNGFVFRLWDKVMIFFGVAVAVRLIYLLLNEGLNPEKILIENVAKRLILVMVMMMVINIMPNILQGVGQASRVLINNMNYFVGVENDLVPSTLIISSANAVQNDQDGYYTSEGEFIGITSLSVDDINAGGGINEGDGTLSTIPIIGGIADFGAGIVGQKDYRYFPNTLYLFILLFISLYACALFVVVALDIAKRWCELIVMIVLSPIPISSIIQDGSQMVTWMKMYISVYLSNFVEFMMIFVTIWLMTYAGDQGFFVQIIILLAGLLFSLTGSNKIAQLLGIETSGSTLQDLANVSMVGRGIAGVAAGIGGIASSIIGGGGRALGYAVGGVGSSNYGKVSTTVSTQQQVTEDNVPADYRSAQSMNDNLSRARGSASMGGASGSVNIDSSSKGISNMSGGDWNMNESSSSSASASSMSSSVLNDSSSGNRTTNIQQDNISSQNAMKAQQGTPTAVRTDTYQQSQLWKDGSPMSRFQNWSNNLGDRMIQKGNEISRGPNANTNINDRKASTARGASERNNQAISSYGARGVARRVAGMAIRTGGRSVQGINRAIDRSYSNALRAKQNKQQRRAR